MSARPRVPDKPLFTAVVTEVPINDLAVNETEVSMARGCSLRRGKKKAHGQQVQPSAIHQALVHSEPSRVTSDSVHGRRSRLSRRWLASELEKLTEENENLRREPSRKTPEASNSGHFRRSRPCRRWLAAELEKLREENEKIRRGMNEIVSKNSRVSSDENKESTQRKPDNKSDVDSLKSHNRQLSEDVFMLKNLVIRLNVELENVQDKLRSFKAEDGASGISNLSYNTSSDAERKQPIWGRSDMNAVAPLLQAYQDSLEDKDLLIRNFRQELDRFSGSCKSVVEENERLHNQLAELDKKFAAQLKIAEQHKQIEGEVILKSWRAMQREVTMTKEQNELLLRQTKLTQSKVNELKNTYHTRLVEMSLGKEQSEKRLQKTQTELYVLGGRFAVLSEECERLKTDANHKIPISVHRASVDECKRLFEELKNRYDTERDNLTRKLATLEANKPDVDIQLVTVTAERDQLSFENKASYKEIKKLEERLAHIEAKLKQSERNRESCKQQLAQAMAFAREQIREQEYVLSRVRTQDTEEASKLQVGMANRIQLLHNKLRSVERGACRELDGMEQKFKEHATGMSRMKEHFNQEIGRLKELIEEKDTLIQQLQTEKRSNYEVMQRPTSQWVVPFLSQHFPTSDTSNQDLNKTEDKRDCDNDK